MLESVLNFIIQYKYVFIFYAVIAGLVFWKRKDIEFQAKIIMLYRTKFGLKAMDRFIKRYREWVVLGGYIGVGIGFIGLVTISYFMIANLFKLFFSPETTSGVSLVLPGVNVPGLGILPFWYWLIAIFLIALIHEFGHGIVARAHKIPVHNTGLVLFGPIIGAFVEPDEKKMSKEKDLVQYSVMAAGPFANIILAAIALLLLTLVFAPIQGTMVEGTGFSFAEYVEGDFPAAQAGLPANALITHINEKETLEFQSFSDELFCTSPGETITVHAQGDSGEESYELTLAANPDNEEKSFLGIVGIQNEVEIKEKYTTGANKVWYYVVDWMNGFLKWLYVLSLGIGLFNLLPLPIVDGGRMVQVFLRKKNGKEKGDRRYQQIGMFFLFILVFTLLFPLIRNIFSSIA